MSDFKFSAVGDDGKVEAEAKLSWYSALGYYRIQIVGIGPNEAAAEANGRLMMGQARAALTIASENRVPTTEDAGKEIV